MNFSEKFAPTAKNVWQQHPNAHSQPQPILCFYYYCCCCIFPLFSHIIFSLPFLLRATFHFLRRISDLLSLITINVVRLTFFLVFFSPVYEKMAHIKAQPNWFRSPLWNIWCLNMGYFIWTWPYHKMWHITTRLLCIRMTFLTLCTDILG